MWSCHFWQIDGENVGTVSGFIFLGSRINVDGDYGHEIKRCLLLGGITMSNLDSVLKSRDVTLLTKVHVVKAMVFPVVMYTCESWTIKKAGHPRMNAFKLWCWRRQESLGQQGDQTVSPKGNQPWICPARTDAEADTPILWPLDGQSWLIGKDPDAGKD